MTQTANYGLSQWDPEDRILRTDFNSDNAKIDAAIAGLAASAGNCEMELLTYTGTGEMGTDAPTKIAFSQTPDCFLIAGNMAFITGHGGASTATIICKSATATNTSFVDETSVTWNGSQLSLTNTVNARYQMNTSGKPYWVLGLRKKEE